MTETTHRRTFEPLAFSPLWHKEGAVALDVPRARADSSGRALNRVRVALARIANQASRRTHGMSSPPQTIYRPPGRTPRSR